MKAAFSLALVLGLFMLAGCGSQQAETMVLFGDMNEDPFLILKDKDSLNLLE